MPHHIHEHPERTATDYRFRTFEGGRIAFVSGVFDKPEDAEKAVLELERRGYPRDHITVLMSEDARRQYLGEPTAVEVEKGTKAVEGLGAGSAIGGALGAIAGALAAVGTSLIIPGVGLVVAGPLAAALAGAGAGGAAGGLIGLLVGAGMPEYRAKYYEERIKEGAVVVGVDARSEIEADALEEELKKVGADDVKQS